LVMIELGSSKQKIMYGAKLTAYLKLIVAKSLASIHLVNLSTATNRWVKPSSNFLKGPKRSSPHIGKGHVMGMVWSSWAGVWTYITKYWHPLQDLTI
jgi:hypothetical protein